MPVRVNVQLTQEGVKLPFYAHELDAGADVKAAKSQSHFDATFLNDLQKSHDFIDVAYKPLVASDIQDGDWLILPGHTKAIDLGFCMAVPKGFEMQVRSRSGLSKRGIFVANSPGTIDSGYRGPCMVLLRNANDSIVVVKPGDRIAQFVLKSAPQADFYSVKSLDDTKRGTGGFGSTGVR